MAKVAQVVKACAQLPLPQTFLEMTTGLAQNAETKTSVTSIANLTNFRKCGNAQKAR
jgi:hypothetical protein